jgi:glutamyl/glutaminyl-tRNA synthetase
LSPGARTRIAPTPSGFLHAGNAWSFLIAWLWARSRGGSVHLRIDDLDTARMRPEFVEEIFASLSWLGLDWDSGPRDAGEFGARFSQRHRLSEYRGGLEALRDAPMVPGDPVRPGQPVGAASVGDGSHEGTGRAYPRVYPCACSRERARQASLAAGTPGLYAGTCREAGLPWARAAFPGRAARENEGTGGDLPLRARVPAGFEATLRTAAGPALALRPGRELGDFLVWGKDGLPAYQLASVVDDEALGIDLVARGADLLPSSGAQAWLAESIGARSFRNAAFLHHPLLLSAEGGKLSKSAGSESLRSWRMRGGPEPLLKGFAAWMGIDPGPIRSARDLVTDFSPGRIPRADRLWPEFAAFCLSI